MSSKVVRKRGERGSALLVATIMIVVCIAFVGLLLQAPHGELTRTSASTAKERATESADAGIRDAILWLTASGSPTELAASTGTLVPAANTSTAYYGYQANSYYPQSLNPTTPLPVNLGVTGTVVSKYYYKGTYVDTLPVWETATYPQYFFVHMNFGTGGTVDWRIVGRAAASGATKPYTFQVISVGTSGGGSGVYYEPTTNPVKRIWTSPLTTTIEAWLTSTPPSPATIPGAVSAMNPTNATTPATWFDTQNGGSPPSIVGTDAGGSMNIPGVAFQTATVGFGAGSPAIAGSPSPIIGGTSGIPGPTVTQWSALDTLVQQMAAVPSSASPYVNQITYPTTVGGDWAGITYLTIPAGTTVNTALLTISGNHPASGILVIDVGANVTFTGASPVYQKNGTSYFQGAMIFYQRGPITAPANFEFLHKNGNNPNFLQFNSVAVANALAALPAGAYKLASYVIVQ